MKPTEFIVENSFIAQEADNMHKDHEVQMARSQMYSAAEAAIEIHGLLKNISELEGLEGWVQSKLTLASQYLESVRDYLKYEAASEESDQLMPFAEDAASYALDSMLNEGADEQVEEAKHFRTAYGWAGGRNEKTGKTYKHPEQIKADREAKKAEEEKQEKKSVNESYVGRETKDGVWRVFKTGQAVAVAGPFKSAAGASAWIKKQKKPVKESASAGATGAGAVAVSMSGPAGKPGTGKPKKIGNAAKMKKVQVGKGIY